MAKYPKVLQRAHAELDQVVGTDQLPDFTHMKDLPYITSICLELLRWQPVLPVGVPHKSAADDEYRGYFIPNGTIIMANQRAMVSRLRISNAQRLTRYISMNSYTIPRTTLNQNSSSLSGTLSNQSLVDGSSIRLCVTRGPLRLGLAGASAQANTLRQTRSSRQSPMCLPPSISSPLSTLMVHRRIPRSSSRQVCSHTQ